MLKTIFIILAVVFLIILVGFYLLGNMSKTGKAPGLVSGHLSVCPDKPNCVGSEFPDDQSHHFPPLGYPSSMTEEAMGLIKAIIQELGGKVTNEEEVYISAIFTSTLFGFVDDLECRNDKTNLTIHLRSASRVGHSDFGANRKRLELISSQFNERVNKANQEKPPMNAKPSNHS